MRRVLFALFFLSGFSGLVYQVIWTRIAFASFGIILPVLSIVISVFMLGLSAGAWLAGRLAPLLEQRTRASAALYYAATEVFIGLGAFAVPALFHVGERLLLGAGQSNSAGYLWLSAVILTLSIFPWSLAMGATFPLMMAYVRERESDNHESFSFLYLANVIGAMSGTLLSALVLIELFGFQRTLAIAAAGNWTVAIISAFLGWRQGQTISRKTSRHDISTPLAPVSSQTHASPEPLVSEKSRLINWLLFSTGFSAMAMEVVWARAFTPVLRTQVYSFASILFCYLAATCAGSSRSAQRQSAFDRSIGFSADCRRSASRADG